MIDVKPAPRGVQPGRHFIDGSSQTSVSGKEFSVVYPATGEILTTCAEGEKEDVDRAVEAARRALDGPWRRLSPQERGRLLGKMAEIIEAKSEELARLTTLEMGKPVGESSAVDLPHAAEVFRYFGEWSDKVYGETCPVSPAFLNYTLREPLGVVGAITAWNFPLILAAWKLAPALAVGNTVVLKPAEQAPLGSLMLGEIAMEAGLPPGVVNVVSGFGPTAGAALSAHPGVDKVAFTGEHKTAQEIVRASASNLKKVSFECGGKSPHIIFEDADLKRALSPVVFGIFSNQGQVCNAGSRLFLHRTVKDQFLEMVLARTEKLRMGDPLDRSTDLGPVVSREQLERVLGYIEGARAEGVQILRGGSPSSGQRGFFLEPTILTGVHPAMQVAREEVFGPVLAVIEFDDEDELLRIANGTVYGLAAGVWTRDVSRAHRIARNLEAGVVWVNCFNVVEVSSPFGGYKVSGIGKELGRHALDLYTQTKSVWVKL